ncbi:MAG: hypothetical protein M1319_03070 [Chloroflexi bacterium]|nr:hypothetical protein [Chloroflexota bacterium]
MRAEGFKLTVAMALIVGTATAYVSFLTGAGYFAILQRTAVSIVVLGKVGWAVLLVVEVAKPAPVEPATTSKNLVDFVAGDLQAGRENRILESSDTTPRDELVERSEFESLAKLAEDGSFRLAGE